MNTISVGIALRWRYEEILDYAWLGLAELIHRGPTGSAKDEGTEDVGVHHIGDLVVLPRNC